MKSFVLLTPNSCVKPHNGSLRRSGFRCSSYITSSKSGSCGLSFLQF